MTAGGEVDQQQQAHRQLQDYTNRTHKIIVFSDRQYTLPLFFYAGYRLFEASACCAYLSRIFPAVADDA